MCRKNAISNFTHKHLNPLICVCTYNVCISFLGGVGVFETFSILILLPQARSTDTPNFKHPEYSIAVWPVEITGSITCWVCPLGKRLSLPKPWFLTLENGRVTTTEKIINWHLISAQLVAVTLLPFLYHLVASLLISYS